MRADSAPAQPAPMPTPIRTQDPAAGSDAALTAARLGDLALVRDALRGEASAIDRFVERMRCVPRILSARNGQLRRPLRDEELEDVAQDTLAAVWRKLESYDGQAALETWVHGFCTLELLRRLRRAQRASDQLEPHGRSIYDPIAPPEAALVDFEHVHSELELLDPEERSVLELKHFEDLTFDDLARRLSISPNTAKTRYYRGLAKLRARLSRSTDGGVR